MAYMGFDALKAKLAGKGNMRDPGAVAASIGRKKYGTAKMAQAGAFGREQPSAKPMLKPRG